MDSPRLWGGFSGYPENGRWRPKEKSSLLLTRILRQPATIPKGLRRKAQGCELASYPGLSEPGQANPNGVAAVRVRPRTQPRWG